MGEDRNRHSEAGKGDKDGLGHSVGTSPETRRARIKIEGETGMGQRIPDKVRREIDGTKGKTINPKKKR